MSKILLPIKIGTGESNIGKKDSGIIQQIGYAHLKGYIRA
jgi:hypothetical protein